MRKHNPLDVWTVGFITVILTFFLVLSSSLVVGDEVSEINMIPSSNQIVVGQEFTLTVFMYPVEAIGGWSLTFRFDQNLVHATNVTPGINWTEFFSSGEINNVNGTITEIQTWSMGPYPTINHTLCVIRFQAIHAGVCGFTMEQVQVTNTSFETVPVSFQNITVTIVESSGGGGSPGPSEEPPGYLIDTDQDGTYDVFHNNETENETKVQKHNYRYFIDSNGDGLWDFIYDSWTKEMTQYPPTGDVGQQNSQSFFILGALLGTIGVLLIILLLVPSRKKKKPTPPAKTVGNKNK
jgi:hypothetical protein